MEEVLNAHTDKLDSAMGTIFHAILSIYQVGNERRKTC